jgi:hypothetical protein
MAIRNTIEIHSFLGKKKKKSFFLRCDWWGQVRVFLDFAKKKKKKIMELRVFSYF